MNTAFATLDIWDADDEFVSRLRHAIEELGGKVTKQDWGVAGSVEVSFSAFQVGDAVVQLELDNYGNGLLSGPAPLVELVSKKV